MNTHINIYIYPHHIYIYPHQYLGTLCIEVASKNPRTRATTLGEHTFKKNANKHMYNTEIVIKHLP